MNELLNFIIRTTSDGVIIVDNHTQHIITLNPAAAAMLAITLEDALNQPVQEALKAHPTLIRMLTHAASNSEKIRLPRRRLAIGVAATINADQRVLLIQDVTEQQDLDTRREALKNTLSHDLRNPISALGGFADLVAKFGDLNEQQAHFLTRVQQTTDKLYDVTSSLVDLAWIEAGMPLTHTTIDLETIIHQVVQDLSSEAEAKQIYIAIAIQQPMPLIMGDPDRMKIAIYNVLHNAIVYSPPESPVAIHAWGDTQQAFVSIADRGIGISPDEIEQIFDRLYRSKNEVVRKISGGGINLTMSRTIIKRHGGKIDVTSTVDQGSTFTITLPASTFN